MKVEVKTGTKKHRVPDRHGVMGTRLQPVVEVWIGGVKFEHECATPEDARKLVLTTLFELGVK